MLAYLHAAIAALLHLVVASAIPDPFRPWIQFAETYPGSTALTYLLGGPETLDDFFALHFDTKVLLVRHSDRSDRTSWTRIHRRWVQNENIDAILIANSSATSSGPLQLSQDVVLTRGRDGHTEQIATHWGGSNRAVDVAHVHAAFRDGFALQIRSMERRSAPVAAFSQALRKFWDASVSAELRFAPSAHKARGGRKTLTRDAYFVQLDGTQEIEVTVHEGGKSTHDLSEGDVLYVPRGARFVFVPNSRHISLHLAFYVNVAAITLADGVRSLFNVADALHLDERLSGMQGPTWRALLCTAAGIAARVTPGMRAALLLAPGPAEALRTARGMSAEEILHTEISRFTEAAERGGLLRAVAATLAEGAEVEKSLVQWARDLAMKTRTDREELKRIENMFAHCLRAVQASPDAAAKAVHMLRRDAMKMENKRRHQMIWAEMDSLRRHGQKFKMPTRELRETRTMSSEVCRSETLNEMKVCHAPRWLSAHAINKGQWEERSVYTRHDNR